MFPGSGRYRARGVTGFTLFASSMANSRNRSGSGGSATGSSLVVSAMAGAVLGAAGLAWWLLSEADRRRQALRQIRLLRQSMLKGDSREGEGAADLRADDLRAAALPNGASSRPVDGRLQDRVQQLNQQIDEVRRQLEQMQSLP